MDSVVFISQGIQRCKTKAVSLTVHMDAVGFLQLSPLSSLLPVSSPPPPLPTSGTECGEERGKEKRDTLGQVSMTGHVERALKGSHKELSAQPKCRGREGEDVAEGEKKITVSHFCSQKLYS